MLFKANCAVIVNGARIEKGGVVDISPELAASIGTDYLVSAESATKPAEEVVVDDSTPKSLEDLSLAELKEEAKKLDLVTSGTKADLVERIKLAAESTAEEVEDDSE